MSLRFLCMLMHFFILSIAFSLLVRVLAMDTGGGGEEGYGVICVARCPLCAFYRELGDKEAYFMSVEEVLEQVGDAVKMGATELHIVGSLNPEMNIEYFENIFTQIRMRFPGVCIKTATEIEDRIREIICPGKLKAGEWLRIMEIAHGIGLRSNATMLFGHVEQHADRATHLLKLRELQEKTGGFVSFIPLLFHPENTELGLHIRHKANPVDVLKTISRIVLRNFRSIRAYWVTLGTKLAQVALNYGANDLDGTLMGEKVTHAVGAKTPRALTIANILALIRGANKIAAIPFYIRVFTSPPPDSYLASSSYPAQVHHGVQ